MVCFGTDGRPESKTKHDRGWFKWWPQHRIVSPLVSTENEAENLKLNLGSRKISKSDQ